MKSEEISEKREAPVLKDVACISEGWINKYILTYVLPDGTTYEYESVSRKGPDSYRAELEANGEGRIVKSEPDAICIMPVLQDGRLLLIREFRYAVNGWVIAFPAGLKEKDESIRDCVDRELREETGYRLRQDMGVRAVAPFPQEGYSSVGMGDESVLIVTAHVEECGDAAPELGELIETFTLAPEEVAEFLDTNEDLIGTRCQLLLESVRRTNALRKRIALALNPITKEDFA